MPFYVPLGARGWVLHFGGVLTRLAGAGIYWAGARKRVSLVPVTVANES